VTEHRTRSNASGKSTSFLIVRNNGTSRPTWSAACTQPSETISSLHRAPATCPKPARATTIKQSEALNGPPQSIACQARPQQDSRVIAPRHQRSVVSNVSGGLSSVESSGATCRSRDTNDPLTEGNCLPDSAQGRRRQPRKGRNDLIQLEAAIDAERTGPCRHQIQKDEAEEDRWRALIEYREEALGRMNHPIGDGHFS
jgi:hypothetical protein